jgi:hypothetical protein
MKFFTFCILLLLGFVVSKKAFAQDTMNIPKGIVYKKAIGEINNKAQELISNELSVKTVSYSLFDSIVVIGPVLWEKYSNIQPITAIKEGNISLKVSSYNSKQKKSITELVSAKLIQRKNDYRTVLAQIVKDINGKPLKFRNLNELDLIYYWSVIFFDIEEPIFIIEANGRKFLFDLDTNYKVKWIDEML